MSGLFSTGMGDHLQMGKPSQYVTSHIQANSAWPSLNG